MFNIAKNANEALAIDPMGEKEFLNIEEIASKILFKHKEENSYCVKVSFPPNEDGEVNSFAFELKSKYAFKGFLNTHEMEDGNVDDERVIYYDLMNKSYDSTSYNVANLHKLKDFQPVNDENGQALKDFQTNADFDIYSTFAVLLLGIAPEYRRFIQHNEKYTIEICQMVMPYTLNPSL